MEVHHCDQVVMHLIPVADQVVFLLLPDAMDRTWGAAAKDLGQTTLHIWSVAALLVQADPADHLGVGG